MNLQKPCRVLALSLILCVLSGCASVTVARNQRALTRSKPVYEVSQPYFLMGLISPRGDVDVGFVCIGKGMDQVETVYTLSDLLTGVLTLGIYVPRTVKVWCRL